MKKRKPFSHSARRCGGPWHGEKAQMGGKRVLPKSNSYVSVDRASATKSTPEPISWQIQSRNFSQKASVSYEHS